MLAEAGETNHLHEAERALIHFLRPEAPQHFYTEADIAVHVPPRQQTGLLEHDRTIFTGAGDHLVVKANASCSSGQKPCHQIEQSGFAAAARRRRLRARPCRVVEHTEMRDPLALRPVAAAILPRHQG